MFWRHLGPRCGSLNYGLYHLGEMKRRPVVGHLRQARFLRYNKRHVEGRVESCWKPSFSGRSVGHMCDDRCKDIDGLTQELVVDSTYSADDLRCLDLFRMCGILMIRPAAV